MAAYICQPAMQIRAYLYLMAAAVLAPPILFAGFALHLLARSEGDLERAKVARAAERIALLVDAQHTHTQAALRVLGASPALARGDLGAFLGQARVAADEHDAWCVLMDEQGRMLFNTLGRAVGTAQQEDAPPAYFRTMFAQNRSVVSDVMPGRASGRLITAVAIPQQAGGRRYALAVGFGTDYFRRLLAQSGVPRDWQIDLVDRKGKLVASSQGPAELVGQDAAPGLVAAAARSREGMFEIVLRNGGPGAVAFTRSAQAGWLIAVGAPAQAVAAPADGALRAAVLALAAALAGAAAAATWFGRSHARSFRLVHDVAGALARGEFPPPRRSRITEIDRVLVALRQAGSELKRVQATRESAGYERQSQLERAQQARDMAEEENRAKDQFLAMLGHELRNPLAPIGTAAQLLKLPDLDAHRARYAGDVIGRQVEHMNRLLSDMLDVSRVTRGLVTMNLEDVDLRDIVERAVEQTRPLMEERQHRLELRLPNAVVTVRGDQTRLTQVVANLLTNSAKYTPAHGAIQLSLAIAGDEATLSVADDGEGITAELLPRVFDLFSQGERKADRAQGGLGLGLALVRSLVQLHGGSVEASSPGRGSGSIFTVRLPLKAELAALAASPPARFGSTRSREAGREGSTSPPAALRVMLVDDNIDAAVSLSLLLEAAGDHLVSTYYDAGSALEWAAFERPDVFILDIGLPDMNGYELARRLRAMPQFAHTLLIALTGYGQLADKARAREAGFDLHIAKPAEPEEILGALSLANTGAEAERSE